MTVKAWLEGHQFDLEALANLLPTGDIRVVKEQERYYLTSSQLDSPPPEKTLYELAPDLLTRVNGLGRVNDPGFRPVALTMTFQEGEHKHHVLVAGTIEVRSNISVAAVVTATDGTPPPQAPPAGPQHVEVAGIDADVAQALTIMGQPEPLGWVALYKVYEIIRASSQLRNALLAAGLTDRDLRTFTHTANHPDASGLDGRHARSAQEPPTDPMPLERARELVSRLVRAWIELLA